MTIYYDNQQILRLLQIDAPKLITKLKHIDIHSHWLRQEVQKGIILLKYKESSLIMADRFTKELPKQKHKTFIHQLHLISIKDRIKKSTHNNNNSFVELSDLVY